MGLDEDHVWDNWPVIFQENSQMLILCGEFSIIIVTVVCRVNAYVLRWTEVCNLHHNFVAMCVQGSYRSWESGKVMDFAKI